MKDQEEEVIPRRKAANKVEVPKMMKAQHVWRPNQPMQKELLNTKPQDNVSTE